MATHLQSTPSEEPRRPVEIFCMYADETSEDKQLREKLEAHLSLLEHSGRITVWHKHKISAGAERASEIEAHLNSSQIILLLVTPNFLASPYCYGTEMQRVLTRHKAQEARVIPIILRPCDWTTAPFSHLQELPRGGQPVVTWNNQDEAFKAIVRDIDQVVTELNSRRGGDTSSRVEADPLTSPMSQETPEAMPTGRRPSAFHFNQPLPHPREFFGRAREHQTLLRRTDHKGSTSIVGPRRIGKTWLMNYLRQVARQELGSSYLVGYLDAAAEACSTVGGFATRAVEKLGGRPALRERNGGLRLLERHIQDLASRHHYPVLCIDEFETFDAYQTFDLNFFNAMRAMTQDGLCLVVASKIPLMEFANCHGKTSGFFNVFEQLRLQPFNSEEARRFVQLKGRQTGLTRQEQERLLLYGENHENRGEYWPIRLQLVGEMLLGDKHLGGNYYRPKDAEYWEDFQRRLEETYKGTMG